MDLIYMFMEFIHDLKEAVAEIAHKIAYRSKQAAAVVAECGRRCEKCEHYAKGSCWHPDFETRDKCITSIRPVGYKRKEGK